MLGSNTEKMEEKRQDALEMAKEKKKKNEEKSQEKSRRALSMIHLLIIFLILIVMAFMVVEEDMHLRAIYFVVCVVLIAIYNVVHASGLKMSLEMLTKNSNKLQKPGSVRTPIMRTFGPRIRK
ncbi:MAG: hypothetical protein QXS93_00985 [Candidatus Micrarchaeia archaeon]